jgi:hypothetical protein
MQVEIEGDNKKKMRGPITAERKAKKKVHSFSLLLLLQFSYDSKLTMLRDHSISWVMCHKMWTSTYKYMYFFLTQNLVQIDFCEKIAYRIKRARNERKQGIVRNRMLLTSKPTSVPCTFYLKGRCTLVCHAVSLSLLHIECSIVSWTWTVLSILNLCRS